MSDINYSNDRLEFGQIILSHIQQILKLSMHNLCDMQVCMKYQTAVLTLNDALDSYFDDEMIEAYKEFEKCNKDEKYKRSFGHFRKLFRDLLGLVKRVDYFKGVVYGESKDDIIEDDGGESE